MEEEDTKTRKEAMTNMAVVVMEEEAAGKTAVVTAVMAEGAIMEATGCIQILSWQDHQRAMQSFRRMGRLSSARMICMATSPSQLALLLLNLRRIPLRITVLRRLKKRDMTCALGRAKQAQVPRQVVQPHCERLSQSNLKHPSATSAHQQPCRPAPSARTRLQIRKGPPQHLGQSEVTLDRLL